MAWFADLNYCSQSRYPHHHAVELSTAALPQDIQGHVLASGEIFAGQLGIRDSTLIKSEFNLMSCHGLLEKCARASILLAQKQDTIATERTHAARAEHVLPFSYLDTCSMHSTVVINQA